ncbi:MULTISPECIES: phosphoribosylamine--glycine ligase [Weeksella]|uniref:Phosphoribosylamine--glycine ligase n=1 Tax=Weeksella virosa (strain ATCC 43766 / DSM 16922 / JCM 21250 / CCUG 30538 / CDC 9751 / IAM 14551 / NBRC 16016 / NCTC 11634 / CL345/78) TaxID=865938 RepID=F0NZ19_WEEVC|nr:MULTISPECIES: phosphoribosylamine--glycine ligase [Weeksella]ADX68236.1 Phosphoribosylamine--glycine ligase [Weeksella virosa DSM 16922]MDK7374662.1 phosphoribosylamine--glycine ligase [Weeksella virosa]MDK7674810.1 phosphoribosylamine--glycine ligase [Weeksella virosa]OFM83246.1 phosphoribosylamine--glycine ligase [Weeksella sp. HMSC059D05]SUP54549.1 Phosphoribosylamine--glycine ligase [Weeksella virosa]
MSTKILIVGSGGREHAIGWKFAEDFKRKQEKVDLFFVPGNAGTAKLGENIALNSITEMKDFALENKIDLTFVGPEAELAEGIVDLFQANHLPIFGPHREAAKLESSKAFAKDFMHKYGVKTAEYKVFQGPMLAIEYLEKASFPIVIKASGLAAGKGVIICQDFDQAKKAVLEIMEDKTFGDAGNEVVIEEYLEGFEASILSFFNGKTIIPFISAKDHKKIGEGETGLNTGGMGAIAPNPLFTEAHYQAFLEDVLEPTKCGLIKEGLRFSGVIFFGLMITTKGVYLLEYNLRMGDPETQTTLPLLENDLYDVVQKTIKNEEFTLEFSAQHSCCVVMVSGGYPGNYEKGYPIRGLDQVTCPTFIAGAKLSQQEILTSGGRVLNVVGIGKSLEEARKTAYENVAKIHFDYEYYRNDIGEIKKK